MNDGQDTRAVVAAARSAQADWAALSFEQRAQPLRALRKRLLENGETLVEIMWREVGKPFGDSFASEIVSGSDIFSSWIKHAPRLLGSRKVALDPLAYRKKSCRIELAPKGVIGLITPWNLPLNIALRTIVPGLLAGNTVVWKPSEVSTATARAFYELAKDLFPSGVFGLLTGDGRVGAELVASGVDHVSFTGSVATGRAIERSCAERGISVGTELGGKDAAIVLADCLLPRTVEGVVWGAFTLTGQNCASVERAIVEQPIAEEFIAACVAHTKTLRCGPELAYDRCDVGPLATDRQVAVVEQHVEDAVRRGARVLTGGKRLGGRYFAPTVIVDVPLDAPLWRDETFGPVLPIAVVRDSEEALRLANDSRYGLTTSIWTGDLERGAALAARAVSGVVTVNNVCFTGILPMAVWTGVRDSGSGRTNSEFALYELTRPRTVLIDRYEQREVWWYPFTPALRHLLLARARFLAGHFFAVFGMIRWLARRFRG